MRFMMFIKHPEDYGDVEAPQALYGAMDAFIAEHAKNGVFIEGAGLQPLAQGARVRLAGGRITVSDGPFIESKDIVGGYALCECSSFEEAKAFATEFMELHRLHWPEFEGVAEVRAVEGEAKPAAGQQNAAT